MKRVQTYLKELGFSKNEIRVYLALTELGEAIAREIAKKADLPRTTAISILQKLKDGSYITTHVYKGVTYFWIESPQILVDVLENKRNIALVLKKELDETYRTQANFPQANVYDTKSGIKNFINNFLASLEKKSVIKTIDVPGSGNYKKVFDENISNIMNQLKIKKQIKTKILIPVQTRQNLVLNKIKNLDFEIRELPVGIDFKSSLWFAKNTMVQFSGYPPFLVATKHGEIVTSQESLYDYLWGISKIII